MKNKNIIIIIIAIVAIILIAVVVFLIVRRRNQDRNQRQAELEAQLQALQAAQSNPNTPFGQRAGIGQQIANVLAQLASLKSNAGVGSGNEDEPAPLVLTWNGGGSGICLKSATLSKSKKMKRGMTAPEVCQLQTMLNKKGSKLIVDGIFGKKTEDALVANAGVKEIRLDSVPRTFYA